jgi:hypothetical protein
VLVRPHERSTTKTQLKNSLSALRHFTEHLVDVFRKLPWKNNLDHKSSRLSIQWLNSTPGESPATNFTPREQHSSSQAFCRAFGVHKQKHEEQRQYRSEITHARRLCQGQGTQGRAAVMLGFGVVRRFLARQNRPELARK